MRLATLSVFVCALGSCAPAVQRGANGAGDSGAPATDTSPAADAGTAADSSAPATDTGPVADAGPTGPDDYHAGMVKQTNSGLFRVVLVSSDPIPQDLTEYTWEVEVQDAQGNALDNAPLTAEPRMVAHGHGTFPAITEGVPTGVIGRFTLTDMDLFMAGVWRIELRVTEAERSDSVYFFFELDS